MTEFEDKEMEGFFSSSHERCLIRQAILGLQPRDKPGGDSAYERGGMLVENFELNPKRRPIWAWSKHFLIPKRDHVKTQTNEKTWII